MIPTQSNCRTARKGSALKSRSPAAGGKQWVPCSAGSSCPVNGQEPTVTHDDLPGERVVVGSSLQRWSGRRSDNRSLLAATHLPGKVVVGCALHRWPGVGGLAVCRGLRRLSGQRPRDGNVTGLKTREVGHRLVVPVLLRQAPLRAERGERSAAGSGQTRHRHRNRLQGEGLRGNSVAGYDFSALLTQHAYGHQHVGGGGHTMTLTATVGSALVREGGQVTAIVIKGRKRFGWAHWRVSMYGTVIWFAAATPLTGQTQKNRFLKISLASEGKLRFSWTRHFNCWNRPPAKILPALIPPTPFLQHDIFILRQMHFSYVKLNPNCKPSGQMSCPVMQRSD